MPRANLNNHYRATRALLLIAEDRLAEAASEADQVSDPNYPQCLRVRWKLRLVRQEYAEAEPHLRRFLDLEGKQAAVAPAGPVRCHA